ncbi:hypothetical protein CFC21_055422 [Triticum aestivum]|uniref:GRF-type domain-containing protein n=2 Tax=Triticum aestivum TaxID=4565 RepID=A0A9R1KA10_WHEAT|nr:hypothetical protein CFC21_055422 [Triticum aestivum]
MDYEPPKLCHCNPPRKVPRWISWSRQNPGRRYYACVHALNGGCRFIEWHDDPLPKFFSDLIGHLRDEVWRLKGARTEDAVEEQTMTESVIVALQEQLKEKSAGADAVKTKYKTILVVFVVFVLGLVLGKFLVH